jgi:hypothetical protein
VQRLVTLGKLLQLGDCGGCDAGVTGGISGGRVQQPEHGSAAGHRVLPRREHLRGQCGPGGPELIEQARGVIQHRDQRLGIPHRPLGRGRGNRTKPELFGGYAK